jgi:hypothetical protein
MGKVSLINYCEHIVAACDSICDKARVLEHEDFVLRVRNDRSLILRDLYHGQPPEIDHGVRHCGSRPEPIQSIPRMRDDSGMVSLTSPCPLVRTRPPIAERETRIPSRFREQLWQSTMINESNLPRRYLLAYPVCRDLYSQHHLRQLHLRYSAQSHAHMYERYMTVLGHLVRKNLFVSHLQ